VPEIFRNAVLISLHDSCLLVSIRGFNQVLFNLFDERIIGFEIRRSSSTLGDA
jgi:hypothetical protein